MKPSLSPIGQHLRSRAPKPGHGTAPMRGSNKLPALGQVDKPPRVVVVQRCPSMTHDPRVQCAPDEDVPKFFGSKAPGINPLTGKSWETR